MLRVIFGTDPTSLSLQPNEKTSIIELSTYLRAIAGGILSSTISVAQNALQATGLVTFTGAPTADETITIGNVVFTAKASGATGNEFNIGGSVTITAANLVTAINASASLAGIVTATSLVGVVTLTSVVPGLIGNAISLSEGLSNATVTAFANGSNGTLISL